MGDTSAGLSRFARGDGVHGAPGANAARAALRRGPTRAVLSRAQHALTPRD